MSNEVNYTPNWADKNTQCKKCKSFQVKSGKNACVPEGKSFEQAIEKYGEVSPVGHCNFFSKK